jgi:pimeloyl-ACP methyl ester carboxylesterase
MTLTNPGVRTFGQKVKMAFMALLAGLLTIVVVALSIESYRKYQNEGLYPAPGKLYQVRAHMMHLWCQGQGEPTIVLDAGAGMFSSGWRWVMPELSPTTRVCAFDRSGLGWSEPALPPYDGISAAIELNELLQQAEIQRPFIYVGHSLGANLGTIYHHQYPGDLSALVLLEPADPEILLREVGEDRGTPVVRGKPISDCGTRCLIGSLASKLGVIDIALAYIEAVNDPGFQSQALAEFKARTNRTESLEFVLQRGKYITEIMFQALDSDSLQDLPVAIFHAENSGELLGDHESEQEMRNDRHQAVLAYQGTVDLSSRSLGLTQIENANHLTMVMYQEPAQQVAGRILEILEEVREQQLLISEKAQDTYF